MSEARYWQLCLRGELGTGVFVCGLGYTLPNVLVEGDTYLGELGSGPESCMPLDLFLDFDRRGLIKKKVYVCGVGWKSPSIPVYSGSGCGCGSCGCGSCGCGSCGSSGSLFDIDAAVDYLISNAEGSSIGSCAKYVRLALEAGGFSTEGRPNAACEYDTYLKQRGFYEVDKYNYVPQKGDIVVHEAIPADPSKPGDKGHPYGHIAMYTGEEWVSDFVQRDMFGGEAYRKAKNYTILRQGY